MTRVETTRAWSFSVLALLLVPALGSGSNWDSYRPRQFDRVLALAEEAMGDSDVMYPMDMSAGRYRVVATGETRPVPEPRAALLDGYFRRVRQKPEWAELHATEVLVLENGRRRWLPIQTPLLEPLAAEAPAGKTVELFATLVAVQRDEDGSLDGVFTVNEFHVPTLAQEIAHVRSLAEQEWSTEAGRHFERQATDQLGRSLTTTRTCAGPAGGMTFEVLLFRLDADGQIVETLVQPRSRANACLSEKLTGQHFAKPPEADYWVAAINGTGTPVARRHREQTAKFDETLRLAQAQARDPKGRTYKAKAGDIAQGFIKPAVAACRGRVSGELDAALTALLAVESDGGVAEVRIRPTGPTAECLTPALVGQTLPRPPGERWLEVLILTVDLD